MQRHSHRTTRRRASLVLVSTWIAAAAVLAASGCDRRQQQPRRNTPGIVTVMPGKSYQGELPDLSAEQRELRDLLRGHVQTLAGDIGERNPIRRPRQLAQAADFIEKSLSDAGHQVARQAYRVGEETCHNLECELAGTRRAGEIVVVAAHYDSVEHCPGANDNGSGVASLLCLARALAGYKPDRTLRFVAVSTEESPYFQSRQMGSWFYAKRCRERNENIVAMLSLETIGYYSDRPGSQNYPPPYDRYYPSTGNFIGFVGDVASAELVKQVVGSFRSHAKFPSEGGALPPNIPGVAWSDHWSFWQHGYRALMVTDTAPFRYPHYHQPTDTPDKIDYDRMARVVDGLKHVIADLTTVTENATK